MATESEQGAAPLRESPSQVFAAEASEASASSDDEAPRTHGSIGSPYKSPRDARSPQSRQLKDDAGERLIRMAADCHALRRRTQSEGCTTSVFFEEVQKKFVAPESAAAEGVDVSAAASSEVPGTVIIFDWDDTLFPTWFCMEVVNPCLPDDGTGKPRGAANSAFAEGLEQHAKLVVAILVAARSVGRVGIVTLAARPWVHSSASRYLPGLDLPAVLKELGIPIIYARECMKKAMISQAEVEEGVNVYVEAKRQAMLKAMKKLYGRNPWKNIISIGDSIAERDAIKELLWSHEQESPDPPICKTVKLMEDPTVEQLGAELLLLGMWLRSMARHGEDFDVTMDDSEESMLEIHTRFGLD